MKSVKLLIVNSNNIFSSQKQSTGTLVSVNDYIAALQKSEYGEELNYNLQSLRVSLTGGVLR